MATGFDEILLQMIEGDPAKRPKPSKILEAECRDSVFKLERAIKLCRLGDVPG